MHVHDVTPSKGLTYIAHHVIGCHSIHETRIQSPMEDVACNAFDDVASTIHQSLPRPGGLRALPPATARRSRGCAAANRGRRRRSLFIPPPAARHICGGVAR